jgi:uncharacterized membrane protein YoaK (UPF0700 family)
MLQQLTWPLVVVIVALIALIAVLGLQHIISPDWIERTVSAFVGLIVGTTAGVRLGASRPARAALPDSTKSSS